MTTYRVEKDGLSFYVQPHMLDYYAASGYAIYKTVEESVTDVAAEIAALDDSVPIVEEVRVNG